MVHVREKISCTEYPMQSCFTIMVVSTLALGSSLTTALHTICFARSAYLMNKQTTPPCHLILLNCTWNSYHQCLNTLKTYIGKDLPLERSKTESAMLVSYRRQFSYTIQCEKAFFLPYPFSDCSQISKPKDLSYHPLECQTIQQYPAVKQWRDQRQDWRGNFN